MLIVTKKVC